MKTESEIEKIALLQYPPNIVGAMSKAKGIHQCDLNEEKRDAFILGWSIAQMHYLSLQPIFREQFCECLSPQTDSRDTFTRCNNCHNKVKR